MRTIFTLGLVIVLWFVLILGCSLPKKIGDYWTKGCITPDEKLIGVAGNQGVLIELDSGNPIREVTGQFQSVVCPSNTDVIGLTGDKAVWLNVEKTIESENGKDVVGSISKEEIVLASRHYNSSFKRYDEPMKLMVESIGQKRTTNQPIVLSADKFPGIGKDIPLTILRQRPVRILPDRKLLLFVGKDVEKSFNQKEIKERGRWGFFTVNLDDGSVNSYGDLRNNEEEVFLYPLASISNNGNVLAISSTLDKKTIIIITDKNNSGDTRINLQNVHEISVQKLNSDGSLLAIGVVEQNASAFKVNVFNTKNGEMLWEMQIPSRAYLIEFLEDNSLITMASEQYLSRREGADGKIKWERSYSK